MATILHLIQHLGRGGAARATICLAKYSSKFGNYRHKIVSLCGPAEAQAQQLCAQHNIEVISGLSHEQLLSEMERADIVQVSWWNNPDVNRILQSSLPNMRSVGWFHVGGQVDPHRVSHQIVSFFDYAVACSPYTFRCDAFNDFRSAGLGSKLAMVYGASDLERFKDLSRKSHQGFNIGYIGTVDFAKMHPQFASLCASISIPEARFMVCGSGGAEATIKEQAAQLGIAERLSLLGYQENIAPYLEIIDVYAYPLCEETYAASEMNIQEVMFAGIPPVVFPHGGLQDLILHQQTGLIVRTPYEYKEAIEFLYKNPAERERLGHNAREYSRQHFGGENAGRAINNIYDELLLRPKSSRPWGDIPAEVQKLRPSSTLPAALMQAAHLNGARRLIESLDKARKPFLESILPPSLETALAADFEIMKSSEVMFRSGIEAYANCYSGDAFLHYWAGIVHLGADRASLALGELLKAANAKFPDWRALWFLSVAAKRAGDEPLRQQSSEILMQHLVAVCSRPQFDQIAEIMHGQGLEFVEAV